MHKFFTPANNIIGQEGKIIGEDVKHIYKVLRLKENQNIIINNCLGEEFLSEITAISKEEVTFKILEKINTNNESTVEISLFQGLPKAAKMDLIVQKGTELGIVKFIPTLTERVDIKLKGDFKKLDRLNRIALEAAKQSKRTVIPEVLEPISFDELTNKIQEFDIFIVPYEDKKDYGIKELSKEVKSLNKEIKSIGILIGPEGGFEENEIIKLKEFGAYIVTLGKRILRTETAGFTITALIQYEFGDI